MLVSSVDGRRRRNRGQSYSAPAPAPWSPPPPPPATRAPLVAWSPPAFVPPPAPRRLSIFHHVPVFRPAPPQPRPVAVISVNKFFTFRPCRIFGRPAPTVAPTVAPRTSRFNFFTSRRYYGRPQPTRPRTTTRRHYGRPWFTRPKPTRFTLRINPTAAPRPRCAGVSCPAVACSPGSVPKVSRGACCARCVRTELNSCSSRKCPRTRCRAGQRYVVNRGGCCGRCVGTPLSRCATAKCPKLACRRDQAYTVPAGSCCGYCRTRFSHRCKNTRCPPSGCALGQTYTVRKGECCGRCHGKPVQRCRGRSCPRARCSINQLRVVRNGSCCATCINRTPSRCKYTRCPRITCQAGQKYRVRRGSCCGSCVGEVLPQCATVRCARISCRRGYQFKISKSSGCCGRCVRKSKQYTLITYNVNSGSTSSSVTVVDAVLQAAVTSRHELEERARRLYKRARACVRRGDCRRRVSEAATAVTNTIQSTLNVLLKGYRNCGRRDRACRRRFLKEATRERRIAENISRQAQLVTQSANQLVKAFQTGVRQILRCRGAHCVHNFAVQARILMKRLTKERKACKNRRCRKRIAKAIRRALPVVSTVMLPSLKQAQTVCRGRRRCIKHIRTDIRKLRHYVPKLPRAVRRAEKRVNRLVTKAQRRVRRCGNKKCRSRVTRNVRKTAAKALKRALRRCNNKACRKVVRKDVRTLTKVVRRLSAGKRIVSRGVRRSVKRSPKRGVTRSVKRNSSDRSELSRLRALLASYRKSATKCGDEDTACINLWYNKIARVSARIAALTGRAGRKSSTSKKSRCRRAGRVRRNLLKQITKCADDDARCVKRIFRRVVKVNRSSRRRRCRASKASVKKVKLLVDPLSLPNPDWQSEYTCVGLKTVFKSWLRRQHLIRAYFLNEAHQCAPADTNCLRAYYRKLVVIHDRVHRNRQEFVRRISQCDACAGIKVRFNLWLKRQRSRRSRLHLQLGLCRPHDTSCMQNNLDRIARITAGIASQRATILKLHSDCSLNITIARPITTAPAARFSSASTTAASLVAVLLVVVALI